MLFLKVMNQLHMMKLIYKLLSSFIRQKFDIVCYNETEWINTQEELFNIGYFWETGGKTILSTKWAYPLVLKNYRTGDTFASRILIMDEYRWIIKAKQIGKQKDVNLINSTSYLRKLKLKKLSKFC